MRVDVGMIDGTHEVWSTDRDGLHHVEVSPSGALIVYAQHHPDAAPVFRAARGLGTWLTADVVDG